MAEFWPIVWLSLRVSGAALIVSSMIGLPLGVWMGLKRFPGKRMIIALVQTGMAMPPVIVGLSLYMILSRSGPLGSLNWLFSVKAMILAQIVLTLPFVWGITMFAVDAVPQELHHQLRTLGASPFQARCEIVREARPGIVLAHATAFGRSLSEVGAVWLVGGNIEGETRVLTTAIVLETGKGHFTMAMLLGAALLSIALAVNIVVLRGQHRITP